jgi:hypothetical protein
MPDLMLRRVAAAVAEPPEKTPQEVRRNEQDRFRSPQLDTLQPDLEDLLADVVDRAHPPAIDLQLPAAGVCNLL